MTTITEPRVFDRTAPPVDERRLPVDRLVLERYRRPALRRRFNKEFRFRVLGPLAGKSVLDVGCGDGLNAVLLAKRGARVTGLDASAGAVALARRRAEVNGVSERTTFVCAPVETTEFPPGSFDVVWGDEILEQVPDDLDRVIRRMASWARPSGLVLFAEPINLCNPLRRFRSLIRTRTHASFGARPLVGSDLAVVRRHVPDLRVRPYCFLGRLVPFILAGSNYERSSPTRRALVNVIDSVDYLLLSLPLVKRLGAVCVMYGHPRPARAVDATHP